VVSPNASEAAPTRAGKPIPKNPIVETTAWLEEERAAEPERAGGRDLQRRDGRRDQGRDRQAERGRQRRQQPPGRPARGEERHAQEAGDAGRDRDRHDQGRGRWRQPALTLEEGDREAEERLVEQAEQPVDDGQQQDPPVAHDREDGAGRPRDRRPRARERLRRDPGGVAEHQPGAEDEGGPPAEAARRGGGERERTEQIADRAVGVQPAERRRGVVAVQIDQRDLAAVREGVAGRAPDERGREQERQRRREAEGERAERVGERAQPGEETAVDEVGRGGEAVADQATGGQPGQNETGVGVAEAELGPGRLERAGGEEREPLVGQADEEQRREQRVRCPRRDRQQPARQPRPTAGVSAVAGSSHGQMVAPRRRDNRRRPRAATPRALASKGVPTSADGTRAPVAAVPPGRGRNAFLGRAGGPVRSRDRRAAAGAERRGRRGGEAAAPGRDAARRYGPWARARAGRERRRRDA
jgi:hypothetical protein